jgi:hypothetical protein
LVRIVQRLPVVTVLLARQRAVLGLVVMLITPVVLGVVQVQVLLLAAAAAVLLRILVMVVAVTALSVHLALVEQVPVAATAVLVEVLYLECLLHLYPQAQVLFRHNFIFSRSL